MALNSYTDKCLCENIASTSTHCLKQMHVVTLSYHVRCNHMMTRRCFTLEAPITTATADILNTVLIFSKKISLDVSCEMSRLIFSDKYIKRKQSCILLSLLDALKVTVCLVRSAHDFWNGYICLNVRFFFFAWKRAVWIFHALLFSFHCKWHY